MYMDYVCFAWALLSWIWSVLIAFSTLSPTVAFTSALLIIEMVCVWLAKSLFTGMSYLSWLGPVTEAMESSRVTAMLLASWSSHWALVAYLIGVRQIMYLTVSKLMWSFSETTSVTKILCGFIFGAFLVIWPVVDAFGIVTSIMSLSCWLSTGFPGSDLFPRCTLWFHLLFLSMEYLEVVHDGSLAHLFKLLALGDKHLMINFGLCLYIHQIEIILFCIFVIMCFEEFSVPQQLIPSWCKLPWKKFV